MEMKHFLEKWGAWVDIIDNMVVCKPHCAQHVQRRWNVSLEADAKKLTPSLAVKYLADK